MADIVWRDDFDGPAGAAPDPSVWRHETGAGGWGNDELQRYTDSRDNAALDGAGHLVITARREPDGSFTSARLVTQGLLEVRHGRVEARIRVPSGRGVWPAFWMLGAALGPVPWPDCGEIDVMEVLGHEPHVVHGTVHCPGYAGASGITASHAHDASLADAFHVYAVDWAPGRITWSVDGTSYHQVTRDGVGADRWVFDRPFFLLLNVAVGGGWPGAPDGSTAFPQQMVVDHVRVHGRP
ncbi:glycoside hydrolase family 16 protein [Microbacterium sp. ARD31]|uniref:glycoside hydrolase family 16 protein n=1 Tax=Microbacterium sp. ARD31 TaxID=2962576 RepID=UPI002882711D|nr:glycoside hydrolase family 16 protein [Microbacterium sp. ARD31]MDT0187773.1 glycoside hydrolase family 16 protein [Microbacterium sp. ARD31]